jgi:Dolichyl-phosphate-mannose-protein mannosyltransferase
MFPSKLNWLIPTPLTISTPDRRVSPTSEPARSVSSGSFWSYWRWWLPVSVTSLLLVLYFVDPFIGDWDGMDYTLLSLVGYPSSMALGRNLFIFGNHGLYVIAKSLFHLPPDKAYLLFKYAVVAQAPFAVIACWGLTHRLTRSVFTATLAASLVTFSPVFVLYGGQVMTDVPSFLLLLIALLVHLHGIQARKLWLVFAGAALMGLGVNLRETIALYLPWLVLAPFICGWKPGRREIVYVAASLALFFLFAFGWFAYWFITDSYYRWVWFGWRESMREESSRHPVSIFNLKPYVTYYFISAPLVFITLFFAPIKEWRTRGLSPLLLLWLTGFFANSLLFFNYSTTVNWRYFLTGLPGLVPLGAQSLLQLVQRWTGTTKRAFTVCTLAVVTLATIFAIYARPVNYEFIQRRAMSKSYRERLQHVPPDAVMISGAQTIAVIYWAAIGEGKWKTIGTGGGWPGEKLGSTVQNYFLEGRRVFLDSDPRWWLPCGWQRDEIPMIVELEKQFNFRRVTDTIFELRPLWDHSASDKPNLQRLLPENRPNDTKKCPMAKS